MSKVNIKINGLDGKTVAEYVMKRATVGSNTRRLMLNAKIIDSEFSEQEKGQLLTCAAISTVLCNKSGELLYPKPTDGSDDNAPYDIYENMDIEHYDALCKAYMDINPLEPTVTLDAKKKKS